MKTIPVTALVINMGTIEPIVELLDKTRETIRGHFEFEKYVIITDKREFSHDIYENKYAPEMDRDQRNLFCIKELWKYFDTSHMLMLQPDGYIIHPELWDDKWLEYDYIGAPWPDGRLGCGGFSLRSKKLAFEVNQKFGMMNSLPLNEDGYWGAHMHRNGLYKFPTTKEAMKFSQETMFDKDITPFGIHDAKIPDEYNTYNYWLNDLKK